jgi:hypothetical protein
MRHVVGVYHCNWIIHSLEAITLQCILFLKGLKKKLKKKHNPCVLR